MPDMSEFAAFIYRLADAARPQILPFFRAGTGFENKETEGGFDPVTAADKAAERAIRNLIGEVYPSHNIRGEEYGNTKGDSRYTWVIDPIDGTRAFISGLPVWGVLIGLLKDGKPVLGLMDQPFTEERFIGGPDGAFLFHKNDKSPIKVRPCPDLSKATLCTTDASLFSKPERTGFDALRQATRLQRYGLDCYAYAALAMGGVDLVVETDLKDFDICGLIPVVEAAGGQVSTWSGKPAAGGGQVLASGDPALHEQALAVLSPLAQD